MTQNNFNIALQQHPLVTRWQLLWACISLLLVGFGQPAHCSLCAMLAAAIGWMPLLLLLCSASSKRNRFLLATLWFTGVQLIQLSWFVSHPFLYIWIVYFAFSLLTGLQFGLLALFITTERIKSFLGVSAIAAAWTLLEWSRLFFLSGFSWNPAGLALTAGLYPLQFASIGGVFFLSFWVLWTNLLGARAYLRYREKGDKRTFYWIPTLLWAGAAITPYLWGFIQVSLHAPLIDNQLKNEEELFHSLLVQTAFPVEETLPLQSPDSFIQYTLQEWRTILQIIKPYVGKKLDLIALPEFTVPLGTYSLAFAYDDVAAAFEQAFGKKALEHLPPKEMPWAHKLKNNRWMVNNAFFGQAIANIFDAPLLIGLEDADDPAEGERIYYSAALFFEPGAEEPRRYAKRVLVPMGEYIPFSFIKDLVARYGIAASFTPGASAEVFVTGKNNHSFSPSICYEETFGHLTREGCLLGAKMLVNLTSDVWYPHSALPQQHFDLARLRTVENGVPLLRACNTGITSALDSLGRIHGILYDENGDSEWVQGALYTAVPKYTYTTLYSTVGDSLIIALSLLLLLTYAVFFRNTLPNSDIYKK